MKKIVSCICVIVLTVLTLSGIGQAGERAGAFSISPFMGGYTFGGVQHLETAPVYGLRLGYDLTKNWGVEAVVDYLATEGTRNDRSINALSYRMDILYNIMPDGPLVPYLAVGGGGLTYGHGHRGLRINNRTTDATINAGGGVKYFLTDSMALRGDVRQLFVLESPDSPKYNWEYTAGLTFLFGGRQEAVAAAAPVEAPAEAPETAAQPEPPLEPVPAAEPAPGRYKYCVTLQGEFDIDQAVIRPENYDEIAVVGNFMKNYPTTTAVIEGHTDNVGTYDHNMELSERRAESIVNHLVQKFGIDRSRLSAKGYGFSRPIADNSSDEGRQKNRRIEAIIDCVNEVKEIRPTERLCMGLVIDFDSGKADIKPQYRDEIAKVADFLKSYPSTTALIEGHTDSIGTPAANMKLSQQRAENVVNYLVDNFGIDRSRLAAKGYGSTMRIAYNNTSEGRQKNRRINAVIDCVINR